MVDSMLEKNLELKQAFEETTKSAIQLININKRLYKENERLNNIINKVIADIEDIRDKNNYYEDYKVDNSILTYWIDVLKGSDKE